MMLLLFVCLMISSVFAMDIAKQFQLMMEQATAPVAQWYENLKKFFNFLKKFSFKKQKNKINYHIFFKKITVLIIQIQIY